MTYTDAMRTAVHSLSHHAPKGFNLLIADEQYFLTIIANEKEFMSLLDEDKRRAVEYMAKVKAALEDLGSVVLMVREGGVEEK